MAHRHKSTARIIWFLTGLVAFCVPTFSALAGPCDAAWDGDKIATAISGRPAFLRIPLRDKQGQISEVTTGQIQAFSEAKARISRVVGRSPSFLICSGPEPNAFATSGPNGELVIVTIGMLRLANGDRDIAAAVIGHEIAHHTKNHRTNTDVRNAAIGVLAILVGAILDSKIHSRTGISGLGWDFARVSGSLVSRKFDRDQEREADDVGFQYLVNAGFNPNGAIRLAERLNQLGIGGGGWFFDSHPGWDERGDRFRVMIAANPEAQRIARSSESAPITQASVPPVAEAGQTAAVAPTYTTSDPQKSFVDGLTAFRARDSATGVRELRAAADAGYAPAQVIVAFLYERGNAGLPKNDVEAVRLYRLAADQGDAWGQANLGVMYEKGRGGLEKDEVEAVRLFRLAADQENPLGQVNLGIMYSGGRGSLTKDDVEAVRLFGLAADQAYGYGQASLGSMYLAGRGGLVKDEIEAARLFRLAVDRGNSLGQADLGVMYANGQGGVPKDDVEAVRLYRLSANQGHSLGQSHLGVMYVTGRGGLTKNEAEALRLFRLSADQGDQQGQSNLGLMYEFGLGGIRKDINEAINWYRKSAAQGNELAKKHLARLGAN